jgi:hypothetical protein
MERKRDLGGAWGGLDRRISQDDLGGYQALPFLSIHPEGVVKGGVRKTPKTPPWRVRETSLYYRKRGKINPIKSRAYSFFKLPRLPRLSPLDWGRFIDYLDPFPVHDQMSLEHRMVFQQSSIGTFDFGPISVGMGISKAFDRHAPILRDFLQEGFL